MLKKTGRQVVCQDVKERLALSRKQVEVQGMGMETDSPSIASRERAPWGSR